MWSKRQNFRRQNGDEDVKNSKAAVAFDYAPQFPLIGGIRRRQSSRKTRRAPEQSTLCWELLFLGCVS